MPENEKKKIVDEVEGIILETHKPIRHIIYFQIIENKSLNDISIHEQWL